MPKLSEHNIFWFNPMSVFQALLGLTFSLLLTSCATLSGSYKTIDDTDSLALKAAIIQFTKQTDLRFKSAFTHLNHNQRPDAVVLLQDRNWCGSGGCTLLIFEASGKKYKLVSQSSVSDAPIYSLNEKKNGWKSLVVTNPAKGAVLLQFDGEKYPQNPSVLPPITNFNPNSASLLIGK